MARRLVSSIFILVSENLEPIKKYVETQRRHYAKKNIRFNRTPSSLQKIGIIAGYIKAFDDNNSGNVSIHEKWMFSIPCYYGVAKVKGQPKITLKEIVPHYDLSTEHKTAKGQIKGHTDQDLLILSHINPTDFRSLTCATKLAAHRIFVSNKGNLHNHFYIPPRWVRSFSHTAHKASVEHGARLTEIVDALRCELTVNGRLDRKKYIRVINEHRHTSHNYDHFDENEVEKWRRKETHNLHKHKFIMDLDKIEEYETDIFIQHKKCPKCIIIKKIELRIP